MSAPVSDPDQKVVLKKIIPLDANKLRGFEFKKELLEALNKFQGSTKKRKNALAKKAKESKSSSLDNNNKSDGVVLNSKDQKPLENKTEISIPLNRINDRKNEPKPEENQLKSENTSNIMTPKSSKDKTRTSIKKPIPNLKPSNARLQEKSDKMIKSIGENVQISASTKESLIKIIEAKRNSNPPLPEKENCIALPKFKQLPNKHNLENAFDHHSIVPQQSLDIDFNIPFDNYENDFSVDSSSFIEEIPVQETTTPEILNKCETIETKIEDNLNKKDNIPTRGPRKSWKVKAIPKLPSTSKATIQRRNTVPFEEKVEAISDINQLKNLQQENHKKEIPTEEKIEIISEIIQQGNIVQQEKHKKEIPLEKKIEIISDIKVESKDISKFINSPGIELSLNNTIISPPKIIIRNIEEINRETLKNLNPEDETNHETLTTIVKNSEDSDSESNFCGFPNEEVSDKAKSLSRKFKRKIVKERMTKFNNLKVDTSVNPNNVEKCYSKSRKKFVPNLSKKPVKTMPSEENTNKIHEEHSRGGLIEDYSVKSNLNVHGRTELTIPSTLIDTNDGTKSLSNANILPEDSNLIIVPNAISSNIQYGTNENIEIYNNGPIHVLNSINCTEELNLIKTTKADNINKSVLTTHELKTCEEVMIPNLDNSMSKFEIVPRKSKKITEIPKSSSSEPTKEEDGRRLEHITEQIQQNVIETEILTDSVNQSVLKEDYPMNEFQTCEDVIPQSFEIVARNPPESKPTEIPGSSSSQPTKHEGVRRLKNSEQNNANGMDTEILTPDFSTQKCEENSNINIVPEKVVLEENNPIELNMSVSKNMQPKEEKFDSKAENIEFLKEMETTSIKKIDYQPIQIFSTPIYMETSLLNDRIEIDHSLSSKSKDTLQNPDRELFLDFVKCLENQQEPSKNEETSYVDLTKSKPGTIIEDIQKKDFKSASTPLKKDEDTVSLIDDQVPIDLEKIGNSKVDNILPGTSPHSIQMELVSIDSKEICPQQIDNSKEESSRQSAKIASQQNLESSNKIDNKTEEDQSDSSSDEETITISKKLFLRYVNKDKLFKDLLKKNKKDVKKLLKSSKSELFNDFDLSSESDCDVLNEISVVFDDSNSEAPRTALKNNDIGKYEDTNSEVSKNIVNNTESGTEVHNLTPSESKIISPEIKPQSTNLPCIENETQQTVAKITEYKNPEPEFELTNSVEDKIVNETQSPKTSVICNIEETSNESLEIENKKDLTILSSDTVISNTDEVIVSKLTKTEKGNIENSEQSNIESEELNTEVPLSLANPCIEIDDKLISVTFMEIENHSENSNNSKNSQDKEGSSETYEVNNNSEIKEKDCCKEISTITGEEFREINTTTRNDSCAKEEKLITSEVKESFKEIPTNKNEVFSGKEISTNTDPEFSGTNKNTKKTTCTEEGVRITSEIKESCTEVFTYLDTEFNEKAITTTNASCVEESVKEISTNLNKDFSVKDTTTNTSCVEESVTNFEDIPNKSDNGLTIVNNLEILQEKTDDDNIISEGEKEINIKSFYANFFNKEYIEEIEEKDNTKVLTSITETQATADNSDVIDSFYTSNQIEDVQLKNEFSFETENKTQNVIIVEILQPSEDLNGSDIKSLDENGNKKSLKSNKRNRIVVNEKGTPEHLRKSTHINEKNVEINTPRSSRRLNISEKTSTSKRKLKNAQELSLQDEKNVTNTSETPQKGMKRSSRLQSRNSPSARQSSDKNTETRSPKRTRSSSKSPYPDRNKSKDMNKKDDKDKPSISRTRRSRRILIEKDEERSEEPIPNDDNSQLEEEPISDNKDGLKLNLKELITKYETSRSNLTKDSSKSGSKRGRKKKSDIKDEEDEDENSTKRCKIDLSATTNSKPSIKVRSAEELYPPLSKKRKVEESPGAKGKVQTSMDNFLSKTPQPKSKNIRICGNCKAEIVAQQWRNHLLFHNGLAWIEGMDSPLDLHDESTVTKVMLNFMKHNNLKQVKCEKCGTIRKSALGLVSHFPFCGKTEEEREKMKVECPHCLHRVLPSGMAVHLKTCAVLRRTKSNEGLKVKKEEKVVSAEGQEITASGRIRRKPEKLKPSVVSDDIKRIYLNAGIFKKWKKQEKTKVSLKCIYIDCNFKSSTFEEMNQHCLKCEFSALKNYQCKKCDKAFDVLEKAREHLKSEHKEEEDVVDEENDFQDSGSDASLDEESSESEGSSGESEREGGSNNNSEDELDDVIEVSKSSSSHSKNTAENSSLRDCLRKSQFIQNPQELLTKWRLNYELNNYSKIPLYTDNLKCTSRIISPPSLQQSSDPIYKCTSTSLSMPKNPIYKSLKALSGTSSSESAVLYTGCKVLQLEWVPGVIEEEILAVLCCSSEAENLKVVNEKQDYFIQFWKICKSLENPEFLMGIVFKEGPIGRMKFCPSGGIKENRIGLLAVSSNKGKIEVMDIPKDMNFDKKWLSVESSFTLDSHQERIITTMDWADTKDHNKIAGGNTFGYVFVWKIDSRSGILFNNGVFTPLITIQPFLYPIKALQFNVLFDNKLLVGAERAIQVLDLTSSFKPVSVYSKPFAAPVMSCFWHSNNSTIVVGLDKCSFGTVVMIQVFNIFDSIHMESVAIHSLAVNKWTGSILFSKRTGDLLHLDTKPLRFSSSFKPSKLISQLKATNTEEGSKFVLKDLKLWTENKKEKGDVSSSDDGDLLNFFTMTTDIVFNPNQNSNNVFAAGYCPGFVTINNL